MFYWTKNPLAQRTAGTGNSISNSVFDSFLLDHEPTPNQPSHLEQNTCTVQLQFRPYMRGVDLILVYEISVTAAFASQTKSFILCITINCCALESKDAQF